MTSDDFDALFDEFHHTAFRWEGLPAYDVGGEEAARIEAMRTGRPIPERSVRTDPWLARIAVTTVAGKNWSRLRVVDEPLTEYQRLELTAYAEAQAAGDQTFLAPRSAVEDGPDFWLFDAGTPQARGFLMRYDAGGHWLGLEMVTEPSGLAALDRRREQAQRAAVALNVFLAVTRD